MTEGVREGLDALIAEWRVIAGDSTNFSCVAIRGCANELDALLQRLQVPHQEYYAKALALVADTLMTLKPDDLEARAPKLVAIIRNAAIALEPSGAYRATGEPPPAQEQGWQPIDTAPKHGPWIKVKRADGSEDAVTWAPFEGWRNRAWQPVTTAVGWKPARQETPPPAQEQEGTVNNFRATVEQIVAEQMPEQGRYRYCRWCGASWRLGVDRESHQGDDCPIGKMSAAIARVVPETPLQEKPECGPTGCAQCNPDFKVLETPQAPHGQEPEPHVAALIERAEDWQGRAFDYEVANHKLTSFEREAVEIIKDLMICICITGPALPSPQGEPARTPETKG